MKQSKTQLFVILTIVILLLFVFTYGTFAVVRDLKASKKYKEVKIVQLYSSDYDIKYLDNNYFLGLYNDKLIVIIDNNGKEVYHSDVGIEYDGMYKLNDSEYLIYTSRNNVLKTYIFDGKEIKEHFEINDISNIKPMIYKNDSEYILGFISLIDDNTYIYKIDNTGVIVLNKEKIVPDEIKDDKYYFYNKDYLVFLDETNKYGIINFNNEKIIKAQYDQLAINKNDNIIYKKNNSYGLIDKNEKSLLKDTYKRIIFNDYGYIAVNKSNKLFLYDLSLKQINSFKIEYQNNNKLSLFKSNNYFVVINETEKETYLYIVKGKKLVKTIKDQSYKLNDTLFTYDKKKIIEYDESYKIKKEYSLDKELNIDNIFKINNEMIYVNDSENYFIINDDVKEAEYGKIIKRYLTYNIFLKENEEEKLLSLTDDNLKIVNQIKGQNISIYDNYIIIDNNIYVLKS